MCWRAFFNLIYFLLFDGHSNIIYQVNEGEKNMKITLVILLSAILISGCSFVIREDTQLRTIGVDEQSAKEVLRSVDQMPEDQKTKIWPRR